MSQEAIPMHSIKFMPYLGVHLKLFNKILRLKHHLSAMIGMIRVASCMLMSDQTLQFVKKRN